MEPALHVLPSPDGGWQVRETGGARPLSVHSHAWAAEAAAMAHARVGPAPMILVRDAYGRTRTVGTGSRARTAG